MGRGGKGWGGSEEGWEGGWRGDHTLVVVGCVDEVTLYLYIKL